MATEQQKEPESSIAYKSESMSVLRILCVFSARTYGALQARVQPWEFPDNALQNYFGIMIQDIEQSVSGGNAFGHFHSTPSRSVCFITRTPKLREIFAADFRDRIVHHLVVRELEKQWEPRFIFDSYACRKNKGIHAAVNRLQQFMLKASCNRKKAAYFLQLDIRSFFMSIDKQILFTIFKNTNLTEELIGLLHEIIFHDCTEN